MHYSYSTLDALYLSLCKEKVYYYLKDFEMRETMYMCVACDLCGCRTRECRTAEEARMACYFQDYHARCGSATRRHPQAKPNWVRGLTGAIVSRQPWWLGSVAPVNPWNALTREDN